MPGSRLPRSPEAWVRIVVAIVALSALLGFAVARFTSRHTEFHAGPIRLPAVRTSMPSPTRPAPPIADSSDWDKLMELFKEAEATPAAAPAVRAFANEFRANDDLEREFEDFEKDQQSAQPRETLQAFARGLSDKAAFRQLVSKFAQDPGFRQAAFQISAKPEVREAIREVLASARASPPRSRSASGHAAAFLRPGTGLGAAVAGSADVGNFAVSGAAGETGSSATRLASIPDAHAAGAKDTPAAGNGTSEGPGRPQNDARSGGYDVNAKLDVISTAGPDNGALQRFCRQYPAFCSGDPPTVRPQFRQVELEMGEYGLWGACFRLKRFSECVAACSDGTCGSGVAGWEACAAPAFAGLDELTCIEYCQLPSEQPCRIPDDVFARRCHVQAADCTDAAKAAALSSLPSQCGALKQAELPSSCPTSTSISTTPTPPPDSTGRMRVTRRCQWYPVSYNNSNWRWVATGPCTDGAHSCPVRQPAGNACVTFVCQATPGRGGNCLTAAGKNGIYRETENHKGETTAPMPCSCAP